LTGVTGGVGAANKNRFDPLKSAQLEPQKVRLNITKTHRKALQTSLKKQNTLQNSPKKMWHVPQNS